MRWIAAAALGLALLTGCVNSPQRANLAPLVSVPPSNEGAGITVGLLVVDERPVGDLGNQGFGFKGGAITTDQDLAVDIASAIEDALRQRGYTVSRDANIKPSLRVELRSLAYSGTQGLWTGTLHIDGAAKATAVGVGSASHERMYRVANEQKVIVAPGVARNQQLLTNGLNDLLTQLFADDDLLRVLRN